VNETETTETVILDTPHLSLLDDPFQEFSPKKKRKTQLIFPVFLLSAFAICMAALLSSILMSGNTKDDLANAEKRLAWREKQLVEMQAIIDKAADPRLGQLRTDLFNGYEQTLAKADVFFAPAGEAKDAFLTDNADLFNTRVSELNDWYTSFVAHATKVNSLYQEHREITAPWRERTKAKNIPESSGQIALTLIEDFPVSAEDEAEKGSRPPPKNSSQEESSNRNFCLPNRQCCEWVPNRGLICKRR